MAGRLASVPKLPMRGKEHSASRVGEAGVLDSGRCTARVRGLLLASDEDRDLMGSEQELMVKYSRTF